MNNNFSLQECNLSNLSKTQLIEMIQRVKIQNKDITNKINKAKDIQAKIVLFIQLLIIFQSNKGEAEEEFISNKLALKLEKIQKEKQDIQRKVQMEEEHIANYLRRKLTEITRERSEIEQ